VDPLVAAVLMPLSSLMVIAGALGVERAVARADSEPVDRPGSADVLASTTGATIHAGRAA